MPCFGVGGDISGVAPQAQYQEFLRCAECCEEAASLSNGAVGRREGVDRLGSPLSSLFIEVSSSYHLLSFTYLTSYSSLSYLFLFLLPLPPFSSSFLFLLCVGSKKKNCQCRVARCICPPSLGCASLCPSANTDDVGKAMAGDDWKVAMVAMVAMVAIRQLSHAVTSFSVTGLCHSFFK